MQRKHRKCILIILSLLILMICVAFAIAMDSSTIKADSCPPAIIVNDETYYCWSVLSSHQDEIEILGYTESDVPRNKMPRKNNESNFLPVGQPYGAYEGEMCIYFDGNWYVCEKK